MSRIFQSSQVNVFSTQTLCCNFCKNAGKEDFAHWTRNRDGSIACTILKNIECTFCGGKGHTKSQCKILKERNAPVQPQVVAVVAKPSVKAIASSNQFASLESDSDDDVDQYGREKRGNPSYKNNTSNSISNAGTSVNSIKANSIKKAEELFPALPKLQTYASKAATVPVPVQANPLVVAMSAKDIVLKNMAVKVPEVEEEVSEYQTIGDHIWDFIMATQDPLISQHAGKIVAMIMDLPIDEVKSFYKNEKAIKARINEATDIIYGLAVQAPMPVQVKTTPKKCVTIQVQAKTIPLKKRSWAELNEIDSEDEEETTDNSAWY
jgi:hypothetical protein